MSNPEPKKLIFVPNGPLGNAIFRYMAAAIVNLVNPALEYTLLADFQAQAQPTEKKIVYYPGVDHVGDDIYQKQHLSIEAMEKEAYEDNTIIGYNTLGFFKHTIHIDHLTSNQYINKYNGQGIFVKTSLTLNDANFFNMFYKKLEYFHLYLDGHFQFDYLYLRYKPQILAYMEAHKDKHFIQTDRNDSFLMRDILDDLVLPPEKQYTIAIHLRLNDSNELNYYLALFESMVEVFEGRTICLVCQQATNQADAHYIAECLAWFQERHIPVRLESNSLLVDFNILKQAKILVCSMSTFAWTAAYLSKQLEQCYMPNYNLYPIGLRGVYFRKPIPNTILFPVKTSEPILGQMKAHIVTLPQYAHRLEKLDNLNQQLSVIGLEPTLFTGVHGKDIDIHDAASAYTSIKHITWQNTTLFYDTRVRLNGLPMTRGQFGCAWSHLNLLRQLVAEPSINYYLIMEDDVELIKPIEELYETLRHIPADADFCHLVKSIWYPFILTNQVNPYFYECKKQFANGTVAYIVSKKGAQKILDYTKNAINVPIDDLYNMVFRLTPDFRFYVPTDFLFQEQADVISTIGDIN